LSPDSVSIRLRPSAILAGLLILAHVLALGALAASLGGIPLVLAAAGVILSALVTSAEALQRRRGSALAVDLRDDGRVAWRDRVGRWHDAALAPGVHVSAWLVVLPLRHERSRRKWVVIARDAAPAEELRRLRAWLRWRTGEHDPAAR